MQQLGWEVYGIEPNAAAAAKAAEALCVPTNRMFVGSIHEADWPASNFDLITLSHVLEHLPEPRLALTEIHRWLRADGRVRIWVPNVESAESRLFGALWYGLDVPRHLVHYSPRTVKQLLDDTGFEVERVVPEYQGISLSGSISLAADALLRRRRRYRHSTALYYASLPVASILLGLGTQAWVDISARKR
jgi:SAM-dependent methyltransferase